MPKGFFRFWYIKSAFVYCTSAWWKFNCEQRSFTRKSVRSGSQKLWRKAWPHTELKGKYFTKFQALGSGKADSFVSFNLCELHVNLHVCLITHSSWILNIYCGLCDNKSHYYLLLYIIYDNFAVDSVVAFLSFLLYLGKVYF